MFTHEEPVELQRAHWNLNVIGDVPAQPPGWPVRMLPVTGLPVTVGRVVFVGGPVAAEADAATTAVARVASNASQVPRQAHRFVFVRMRKCLLPPGKESRTLASVPGGKWRHAETLQKRGKANVRILLTGREPAWGR